MTECVLVALPHTLEDVKRDAREALAVQVDFLMIGNLTNLAVDHVSEQMRSISRPRMVVCLLTSWLYLTSSYFEGTSAFMAPPKSSTVLNSAILSDVCCHSM